MIDIFEDIKLQPKLYIADIVVRVRYKPRANSKKVETINLTLEKNPVVLIDGEFPTKRYKDRFLKKIYESHLKRGSMSGVKIEVVSISNCKFSSNLSYNFDYNIN